MYKHQQQVKEFHEKMQLVINDKPAIPSEETLKLRCKLLLEEVLEFCTAAGFSVDVTNDGIGDVQNEIEIWKDDNAIDLIEMADALADIQYVTDGAAVSLGIDLEPISNEVQRSNMTKLWNTNDLGSAAQPDTTPRSDQLIVNSVGENLWLVKDRNGKVIKSPSYSPADIRSELIKQGAEL